ncbi:MAG: hypothetical protein R3A44_25825 [Caldilineaceae bacterium]
MKSCNNCGYRESDPSVMFCRECGSSFGRAGQRTSRLENVRSATVIEVESASSSNPHSYTYMDDFQIARQGNPLIGSAVSGFQKLTSHPCGIVVAIFIAPWALAFVLQIIILIVAIILAIFGVISDAFGWGF